MKTQKIAKNIIKIRKKLNLSQSQLAKRCGITSAAISLIEKGNREPSLRSLLCISKVFSITVSELIGEVKLDIDEVNLFYSEFSVLRKLREKDKRLIIRLANRLSEDN